MQYLDFEKPIEELNEQLEKLRKLGEGGKVDMTSAVKELEEKISLTRKEIYTKLSGWQRVQLSRHPARPYSLFYIQQICSRFIELHGDRGVRDDNAMIGGLGTLDGESVMFVGQQKGINTKDRQFRNFGMANPEGYRKALRLFKLAEKFNVPIVTLIDTPGAYPGLEAEERGQGEAIARNLYEMTLLKVPVICIIIGEGASGGALGIGMGDRVLMLENTWYSVISPESCSSILWHSWDMKEEAAEQLKLTAQHMHQFKLVDGIIKEPMGGAHNNPEEMAKTLKREIKKNLIDLKDMSPAERIDARIRKFSSMGFYEED
ncbi:MAG: acetyl-CoA carboxylase carboxyltransferase subunit alpha [Chitinophagales bacterium]|nr:acetyl-CoA carboxylase carboxyltransferase subunit alpha [Bacteroidota bacterium]MBX7139785.1 acetyl-CoA carboxylase carboxyltransferase subunit alpha [Chitinophagales bacterium]